MITLHTLQTSLPSLHRSPCPRALLGRKRSTICACSSEDAESETSAPHGGDKRQQEVLARIAMLQAQKVRITNFLDERSAYLTKFAKDANTEFDMIGQNAMKELDEVGDQIMERLDSKMQAFEETAEIQRQEIEMNEKVLEDFEDWIEKEKNEGMFFKSLGKVKPRNRKEIKVHAKAEAQKIKEVVKDSAGSKTRMNIYLALMALLGLTIANAVFAAPEVEWRKVAGLGLIFIGLVAQVIYEQDVSPPNALMFRIGQIVGSPNILGVELYLPVLIMVSPSKLFKVGLTHEITLKKVYIQGHSKSGKECKLLKMELSLSCSTSWEKIQLHEELLRYHV